MLSKDHPGIAEQDNSEAQVSPSSLTSQAYDRLRKDIMSGELEPGLKLKIEVLRKKYGFGTSPIREALSLLTSNQFVERIDQRGFRVAKISAEEFDELLKTRCWLEERAIRESVANGTAGWEEAVVLAAYRLSRVPRSETDNHFVANVEWEKRHKHFHMELISACGSQYLLKYCSQLYDQNVRYRQLSGTKAYPTRDTTAEHGSICDAVLARDADLAASLLVTHYKTTGNFLLDQIEN